MSRVKQAAEEPSIESLLDSIRRAIHEEDAAAPESSAPADVAPARPAPAHATPAHAVGLKRRSTPAPHLKEAEPAPPPARTTAGGAPKPLIAPLAPQLQGSLRDLRVSVEPAANGGGLSAKTEDFLALRSRIADLSATRERLARISAGGPSSFASVLGGYVRPDDALSRRGRRGFEPQVPPPPPASALRGGLGDQPGALNWTPGGPRESVTARAPVATPTAIPPLNLPPIERTPPSAHKPAQRPFDAVEEGYIEDALPDPGMDDYAPAEAYADEADVVDGTDEATVAEQLPVEAAAARTDRSILSQEVAEATATAFDRLADTIVSQASGGARSIEDITRDLLRPMLKAWLDANLQGVVERLVREEIDRVARRSGR